MSQKWILVKFTEKVLFLSHVGTPQNTVKIYNLRAAVRTAKDTHMCTFSSDYPAQDNDF